MITHICGGTILGGGSGKQSHHYCDRCGAYTYDLDADQLPDGTDSDANEVAWDAGDDESPAAADDDRRAGTCTRHDRRAGTCTRCGKNFADCYSASSCDKNLKDAEANQAAYDHGDDASPMAGGLLTVAQIAEHVSRAGLGLKSFWQEAAGGDRTPMLLADVEAVLAILEARS